METPPVVSFRDPNGQLVSVGERIFRVVNSSGVEDLRAFLGTKTAKTFVDNGRLIASRVLDSKYASQLLKFTGFGIALEHDRVSFPSYPYEWPPDMLHAAGRLTMDIARSVLRDGFGLKDATPYNVLFRGPRPVFVDVLSFERRDPRDAMWLPYGQFLRTFLLPLLVDRQFGVPIRDVFLSSREGLEPERVYQLCSWGQRLRPPFLTLIALPNWLSSWRGGYDPRVYQRKLTSDPERARFILAHLYGYLDRQLQKVTPKENQKSRWSNYVTAEKETSKEFETKGAFVQGSLEEFRPGAVLDVGCNTGYHSAMAARNGARVVAIDYDPVVVGATWRMAQSENLDILPLVIDLTRPSPATGWRNLECPSFLTRAHGYFDMVLMLAVIHHMLVTERVPLPDLVDLVAELTKDVAVVEFIGPQDPLFRRLARGRDPLFETLNDATFETAASARFDIVRSVSIPDTERRIYLLRKK